MKEYIYETRILDANTNELVAKVSAFSLEGLEEEMGKKKFTGAIERYETSEVFRTEDIIEGAESLEAAEKELEADYLADKKIEEGLEREPDDADSLEGRI